MENKWTRELSILGSILTLEDKPVFLALILRWLSYEGINVLGLG